MYFEFTVAVDLDRTEGKFASKDELAERIIAALESADECTWEGDEGGQYETNNWSVEDVTPTAKQLAEAKRRAKAAARHAEPGSATFPFDD